MFLPYACRERGSRPIDRAHGAEVPGGPASAVQVARQPVGESSEWYAQLQVTVGLDYGAGDTGHWPPSDG